jgi:hypothetical protein
MRENLTRTHFCGRPCEVLGFDIDYARHSGRRAVAISTPQAAQSVFLI